MDVKRLLIIMFIVGACINVSLHAELLIMKQTEAGFVPLDDSDNVNIAKIEGILLRYQWPMSAAHVYDTSEEKRALFTETGNLFVPYESNGEEIFIEGKIREINSSYRVVFFPTTLYELFVIYKTLLNDDPAIVNAVEAMSQKTNNQKCNIDLNPIIEKEESAAQKYSSLRHIYSDINALFYRGRSDAFYVVNQSLVQTLKEIIPDLNKASSSQKISSKLKEKIDDLMMNILNRLSGVKGKYISQNGVFLALRPDLLAFFEGANATKGVYRALCKKIIDLEYEARQKNVALLVRGTESLDFNKWLQEGAQKKIAGSTLFPRAEKRYFEGDVESISISFGNSLFAGQFNDFGACAFKYLSYNVGLFRDPKLMSSVNALAGYTLFIDKKKYIINFNNNLFLISPLSTLAGLFSSGEWFHSRTKAVRSTKEFVKIGNLMTNLRADPANVLSIIRDPFEHASLLSQFIADHGRIVVLYDLTKLPNEEQEAVKNLLKTQNEAAQYYKIMRQTKKWAERAKIKAKEPKEATLTKTAEEQREGGSAAAKSGLRALRAKQEQVAREQEYSA